MVAVLTPTEDLAGYRAGFECLAAALKIFGLPDPCQINIEYFAGVASAARVVWPRIAHVADMWHLRRNFMKTPKP